MIRIDAVGRNSPASRAGIRAGDALLSCSGIPVDDWIDFAFNATGPVLHIEISRGTRVRRHRLSRRPGLDWGLVLEGREPRRCGRRCVFCFIDQLPPGVRPSLRVKDEDVRYSFYQGTYVTLDRNEVDMAISKRLSPIHVSVHATDPDLRGRLLGAGRPVPIVPMLRELSEAGISVDTQIVVVPGWNDGEDLTSTMMTLLDIPGVRSVGVVPVGLTSFRGNLEPLRRPNPDESRDAIARCDETRKQGSIARGTAFAYAADEFFILAGMTFPEPAYYRDCTLRENGIGLISELLSLDVTALRGSGTLCTGSLAAPYLRETLSPTSYRVLEIDNRFFGPEVGVSGLLSGADILRVAGVSGRTLPGPLILPEVMFSHSGLTVDGMTLEDIREAMGRAVTTAEGLENLD